MLLILQSACGLLDFNVIGRQVYLVIGVAARNQLVFLNERLGQRLGDVFVDLLKDLFLQFGDGARAKAVVFHPFCGIVNTLQPLTDESRAGHALMEGNPYAPARYAQANENIKNLITALKSGDLDTFIIITESEALQLHALMMCSSPSFILMKPNTLGIINEIRAFRNETQIPLCFTLDAGPNVHLLYPESEAEKVKHFINDRLTAYCVDNKWIADRVGDGPKKLL